MKNKVRQFPQPPGQAEIPIDQPAIIYSFGDRRFAIQWIITEVNPQPADVVPIQKRHPRQGGHAKRRSE
jgi:hypothetical protein